MKRQPIVHPLLLALFPILSLGAHNIDELTLGDLYAPLGIVLLAAGGLWGLLGLLLRDARRAALLTSALLLWVFSYGHVAEALRGLHLPAGAFFAGWLLLGMLISVPLVRTRRSLVEVTGIVNVVAAALLLLPVLTIGRVEYARWTSLQRETRAQTTVAGKAAVRPNIYYIILDGYARADVLREVYGADNRAFLDHLRRRGFVIADDSHSNYSQTLLSLSSSLNMTYLDAVAREMTAAGHDRHALKRMIADSAVLRTLQAQGYTTMAFATGYEGTNLREADIFLDETSSLTALNTVILGTTPVAYIIARMRGSKIDPYQQHRRAVLTALDHLPRTARLTPPVFVFAHIISPHPPFIFDAHGRSITPDRGYALADASDFAASGGSPAEYIRDYRAQHAFITRKAQQAIDGILAQSRRPTVIIVQSDHGPGAQLTWEQPTAAALRERMSILNAYYLPRDAGLTIPPDITPVNSFRLIFNRYFDARLPLLPNESYYSPSRRPYALQRVTALVRGGNLFGVF